MKPFRFSMQRVLDLRAARLEQEERKIRLVQSELTGLKREIDNVERARRDSSRAVAVAETSRGEDLKTLTRFQSRLDRDQTALLEKKTACAQKLVEQRQAFLKARREMRLMEKLRDRQFAEWVLSSNREMEKLASELYLARWENDKSDEPRQESE